MIALLDYYARLYLAGVVMGIYLGTAWHVIIGPPPPKGKRDDRPALHRDEDGIWRL